MDYAFGEQAIDELLKPFKRILYWMWNRFLLWEKGILEGGKEILWFRMPISMKEQQIIIFFHNE
jgi:hypothetical protein